jgi:hypothetical protein
VAVISAAIKSGEEELWYKPSLSAPAADATAAAAKIAVAVSVSHLVVSTAAAPVEDARGVECLESCKLCVESERF